MQNFDDLALAVASFGPNNKVIFDDLGLPSIMVGVPKMTYADIITGGTQISIHTPARGVTAISARSA